MKYSKAVFHKVDLDTALTYLIMTEGKQCALEYVKGSASPEDLDNPRVLCIECGRSGEYLKSNFDHHSEDHNPCACYQAFELKKSPEKYQQCVNYTVCVDLGLNRREENARRRWTLSCIFSGMLLCTKDKCEQLLKGAELIRKVIERNLNPDDISELVNTDDEVNRYAFIKTMYAQKLQALESEIQDHSNCKYRILSLVCDIPGVHGLLKRHNADISIARNSHAYTSISVNAGSEELLDKIKNKLNEIEPGWGGHPHGTIIGSPAEGTALSIEKIVSVIDF